MPVPGDTSSGTGERMTEERMIRLSFEREHYPISYGGPYRIRWEDTEPAPPKLDRDEIITLKGCLYYFLNDLESRDEDGYIRPNCIAGNKVLEKMIQWLVTIEGQIVKEE